MYVHKCYLYVEYLDHMMELNVLPEEIHKSLIATHETVEQFVFKLFILLLFVLLHNQHVGGLKNVKNPKEVLIAYH